MNEEYLVSAIHQIALITSLPFVHTARRSYRSNDQMKCSDWLAANYCCWGFRTFSVGWWLIEKNSESYYLEEGEVVTRYS